MIDRDCSREDGQAGCCYTGCSAYDLDVAVERDLGRDEDAAGIQRTFGFELDPDGEVARQPTFEEGRGVGDDLLAVDYKAGERAAGYDALNLDFLSGRTELVLEVNERCGDDA